MERFLNIIYLGKGDTCFEGNLMNIEIRKTVALNLLIISQLVIGDYQMKTFLEGGSYSNFFLDFLRIFKCREGAKNNSFEF